jgi:hypothetical protein
MRRSEGKCGSESGKKGKTMKHLNYISKTTPARAEELAERKHPGLVESILGFLGDPVGTIRLHLNK